MITPEKIVADHPKLYSQCQYLEIPPGWYSLIYELSSKLEALIPDQSNLDPVRDLMCCAAQVKEKWGGLRFYITMGTDEMYDIIDEYERLSILTCQECGEQAKRRADKWIATLCDDCFEKVKQPSVEAS